MTGPPELRPLRLGEVIDVAARLTRRDFAALVTILGVLVIWAQVLSPLVAFLTADEVVVVDGEPLYVFADDAAELQATLFTGVLALLGALGTLAALAAMLRLIGRRYVTGAAPAWSEAAGYGLRRIGSVLWIGLLAGLAVLVALFAVGFAVAVVAALAGTLGAALAVIVVVGLGAFLYTRLSLAFPALTEEDLRGPAALRRSWNLVKGRWWQVFGALVLALVIVFGVQLGLGVAIVGVLQLDSAPLVILLTTALNVLAQILVFPFLAATLVVLYYDQRVRKEGLDLELQARSLGELPPERPLPTGAPPRPFAPPPEGVQPLDTPVPPGFVTCLGCGRHVVEGAAQCPYCATMVT